jgi:hypothetical protein
MAAKEIKEKIYRVLDKMSDEDEILFSRNLGRILEEDRNLLKRLSQ